MIDHSDSSTLPFEENGGSTPGEGNAEVEANRREIDLRDRQAAAIAALARTSMTEADPLVLLQQACGFIELTLAAGHCRAIEITPDGTAEIRCLLGTNRSFLGCTRDGEDDAALAAAALLTDDPFTFHLPDGDVPFDSNHLQGHHGVVSGVAISVATRNGPFGAILVYSERTRSFAGHELMFLQSVASVVGEGISHSQAERTLRKSELRLRQLLATTLDAVVTVDRNLIVVEWNRQAEAMFGLPAGTAVGHPLRASLLPEGSMPAIESLISRYSEQRSGQLLRRRIEMYAHRATGEAFPIEITMARSGSGGDVTFTAFIRDISERKRAERELEQREKRFRTIVEKSWSGVMLLDAALHFSFLGSSTQNLIGYSETELVGRPIFEFLHPEDREPAKKVFTDVLTQQNQEAHGEVRFRHKDGRWIWLEGFSQNLLHEPTVGAIVLNYRDVTHRKETEQQLDYRAHYDALTGLPNRLLFRDRLAQSLAHAKRNKVGLAVMFLDLDHFKLVNDALGHSFGDQLLTAVAVRLQEALRASDTISRIGGDEFNVLLPEVAGTESVARVAHKMLGALTQPFHIDGHDLFVTASIGVSCYPVDGDDAEVLLKCADAAMYRAKELGRNQAQLFTSTMNEKYVRRLALEQQLHHALDRGELELFYQPVYDRSRRRIVSLEALLRWRDPSRGMVEPSDFIQLAEDTGMIVPMGEWALRNSCRQLRQWHDQGLTALRIAVNISAVQLHQPDLISIVRSALSDSGIRANMLQLEITESAAMQNFELTMSLLRDLHEMGVGISIDDFGSGQSSLIYLKHFPIDAVKIDKQFLQEVTSDETAAAIVSYVINLAHTLKLEVVAEGVETEEQYSFLRHYNCDLMQGYLFSPPLPANEVVPFLRQTLIRPRTLEIRRPPTA